MALDAAHPPSLPDVAEQELIGGPEEDQPDEDADRRDEEGVEHPRPLGDRHDVAVADRGDGDHREVEHVGEGDLARRRCRAGRRGRTSAPPARPRSARRPAAPAGAATSSRAGRWRGAGSGAARRVACMRHPEAVACGQIAGARRRTPRLCRRLTPSMRAAAATSAALLAASGAAGQLAAVLEADAGGEAARGRHARPSARRCRPGRAAGSAAATPACARMASTASASARGRRPGPRRSSRPAPAGCSAAAASADEAPRRRRGSRCRPRRRCRAPASARRRRRRRPRAG